MKNLFKKISKQILTAAGLLALSLIICFYLAGRINKIAEDVAGKKEMLLLAQHSQEQFALLKEDYQKISPYYNSVIGVFPSSENILPFLGAIENFAVSIGVQQSFKFEGQGSQPAAGLNLNKVPFNIIIGGNMSQFLSYLSGLEKMPYFIQIDSLSLTAAQNFESQGQMIIKGGLYVRQ